MPDKRRNPGRQKASAVKGRRLPIAFHEFAKVVAELGLCWMMVNVPPVR